MGRFHARHTLIKLTALLSILSIGTFSAYASLEDLLGGGQSQGTSILNINKTIEAPELKEESCFWSAGSMRRHKIEGVSESHGYVNFVPLVLKTKPIGFAPIGSKLFQVFEDEKLIGQSMAIQAGVNEYISIESPCKEYMDFVNLYTKHPQDALFSSFTHLPDYVLTEAKQALEANKKNDAIINGYETKILDWFLTAPQLNFVISSLGQSSVTVMHIYTSIQPLNTDDEGLSNLRANIINNDDPMFSQFKSLLEGLNPDKLNTNEFIEKRQKRVIFKPEIEASTEDLLNYDLLVDVIKIQWFQLLGEMAMEIERKDKAKAHGQYH